MIVYMVDWIMYALSKLKTHIGTTTSRSIMQYRSISSNFLVLLQQIPIWLLIL